MVSMGPLIQWCSNELSILLGADASEDFAKYLLSIDDPKDLEDYLQGLLDVNDPKASRFIQELLQKKQGTALPENITVYKKPTGDRDHVSKPSKSQSRSKVKEKKPGGFSKVNLSTVNSEPRMPGDPLPASVTPVSQQLTEDQAHKQGAKRKQKYVALYSKEGEARSEIHLTGRHWCECQAQKHSLVANCLKCGRVVCSQEGSGPCLFCGSMVCTKAEQEVLARNSNASKKLLQKLMGEGKHGAGGGPTSNGDVSLPYASSKKQSGLEKALQHKDKLMEYDQSSARRTQVIDDESDYFSTDSNKWLTKEDREKLRKRRDELRELKHGSRLKKTFTLDFAGRKVVEDSGKINMYDGKDEVVQAVNYGKTGQKVKSQKGTVGDIDIINPNIVQDAPHFVQSEKDRFRIQTSHQKSEKLSQAAKGTLRIQDRELMEMSDEGFCLSMHQPWASLLISGIKTHEGRTWYSSHRGRLWISAASHQPTPEEISEVEKFHRLSHSDEDIHFPEEYPVACLLGCVDMRDCLSQEQYQEQYSHGDSSSPYVFICENPQELVVRFPLKGKHKIWKLDGQILKAAKKGLRRPKDH
ncbi:activating signal cointegrator 1-like [Asterias amurensis]|uniref:activating signal cointegrator 1-like n=1 Tax=Asterias amurensis TaxID=7602 RepID=UPI003AB27610